MTITGQATTSTRDGPAGPGHPAAPGPIETVIRPRSGWVALDWPEIVRSRELLYYFVLRDVKIRYKQTVLGVAWAVLQPLFMVLIFSMVFGRLGNMAKLVPGTPYLVFVFAGLILWTYFSASVTLAGASLVQQQNLLTKVYFPRIFIPVSCVGTLLVDLLISLGLFAVLMAIYGVAPSWQAPLAVPLLALITMAAIGVGSACAALTVLYRDFRFIVVFAVQLLMYLSPVIFPPDLLPQGLHPILSVNPMFGLIDGFRAAVLGTPWHLPSLAISSTSAILVFAFGLSYFRRTERRFADLV